MSHREIDVDALDEDLFVEEEEAPKVSVQEEQDQIQAKVNDVRSHLNKGNYSDAVKRALEQPPLGKAPQEVKDKSLKVVMDSVCGVKSIDIPNIVKTLSVDEQDLLLKYVYRGMSLPDQYPAASLLAWHEKVVESAGIGSIVRVITDRRTV